MLKTMESAENYLETILILKKRNGQTAAGRSNLLRRTNRKSEMLLRKTI